MATEERMNAIMNRRVADLRSLDDSSGKLQYPGQHSQLHAAAKRYAPDTLGPEALGHLYLRPVTTDTSLPRQLGDFVGR